MHCNLYSDNVKLLNGCISWARKYWNAEFQEQNFFKHPVWHSPCPDPDPTWGQTRTLSWALGTLHALTAKYPLSMISYCTKFRRNQHLKLITWNAIIIRIHTPLLDWQERWKTVAEELHPCRMGRCCIQPEHHASRTVHHQVASQASVLLSCG